MQESSNGTEPAMVSSIFDQLRAVARDADRQMAALRRARHDPVAFVQHDPTETLLALRGEISGLRRDVESMASAERDASTALYDLAAASADFVEQRRADLAAITAYVTQYGYEPPPPPSPVELPAEEAAGTVEPPATGEAESVSRPPPARLDTPEEVQLSDVTVDMLRGRTPGRGRTPAALGLTAGRSGRERADGWRAPRLLTTPAWRPPPATEDDTADATALLNFRPIPIQPDQRASPAPRSPPAAFDGDIVQVTPGLWVRRRSTMLRPPVSASAKKPAVAPVFVEERPAGGSQWGGVSPDDSMQSPELSAETRAMLARRKFGKV